MGTRIITDSRELVRRELARGPRTLSELCRWALPHTPDRRVVDAGVILDAMVADGSVTRKAEPYGIKGGLKMTYRLAVRKEVNA